MGHRLIVLLVSACFALVSSTAFALGLGKIKLDSTLNQPLQAEIELFEVRELSTQEIRVGLATREDFDRIGVDKIFFLSDLEFEVVLEGARSPYVRVTSNKIVREPYLNFVVQVEWPSGKLLREYTLLMDLPIFSDAPAKPVVSASSVPSSAAPSGSSDASSQYNPRSNYDSAPARPSSAPVSPSYTGDEYRVQANDTLWEIAKSVRPDGTVSIQQTMLALQRTNPDAFINNNINLLKKGQILRIPDREDMASTSRRGAVEEVAAQNSTWSGDTDSGAQLSATTSYDSDDSSVSQPEGRVKLSSPDELYDSSEGRTGGGDADSSSDALENELAITLEQLDKSSRENNELRSKVDSLEEQIATMERMLEVSSESMKALELSAQKTADAAEAGGDSVVEGDSAVFEGDSDLGSEDDSLADVGTDAVDALDAELDGATQEDPLATLRSDIDLDVDTSLDGADVSLDADDASLDLAGDGSDDSVDDAEVVTTPVPTPLAQVENTKKVVSRAAPPEKGILDIILENVLYIAIGLVVIAGAAFYFIKKKSSDEDDFDDFMGQVEGESDDTVIMDRNGDDETLDLGELSDEFDEAPAEVEPEEVAPEASDEPQTEDVVAEADIYIAYNKYDKAEEMLLKTLAREPDDQDVRLKLLEVYAAQGDAESFDPHFAKLRVFATPAILDRADAMRAAIPNVVEFDESSFDTSDVSRFADSSDDVPVLDDSAGALDVSGDEELSLDLETDANEFDADLSLDLDGLDSADAAASDSEAASTSDFDEDFSLDLDGDDDTSLDLDLELPGDAEEAGFDLELDLPEDDAAQDVDSIELDLDSADLDAPELDVSDLDIDGLDSVADDSSDLSVSASDSADDLTADLNLDDLDLSDFAADGLESGELSLDIEDGALDGSLEDDLANLDADLDLSLDLDGDDSADVGASSADAGEAPAPSFELESDLDVLDEGSLDLSSGDEAEADPFETTLSSDTVVNEALNEEYIEQAMSGDLDDELSLDDPLPLEEEPEPSVTQALDVMNLDEADLDLSSLDDELEALTAGEEGTQNDVSAPSMEEPVTDFGDFEDELESDVNVETVESGHVPQGDVENMGEDSMFDEAISEVPSAESDDLEFELPEVNPDDVDDDDLDFLSDSDETATKLDLARAYIDMGDQEGARDIIREVIAEGNDQQRSEAETLMARMDA